MKKTLIATSMIASVFAMPAFAATTGTLLLQGTVAEVLSIAVTPESVASTLDLEATQTNLKVASVNEQSNSFEGYKISARSDNNGVLDNNGEDSVAYTISYDGGAHVALTSTDQDLKTVGTAGLYNHDSDVNIAYTGEPAAAMVEGTYTDTITFTIATN